MGVAVITGASRGLGEALAEALAGEGWSLVLGARGPGDLERVAERLRAGGAEVAAVPGDVAEPATRRGLVAAAAELGGTDLVVNNASTLGPTPLPPLARYPLDGLRRVYEVDVVAPLALVQEALPHLRRSAHPAVLNVTSDASVEPYEGWGGYGPAKAALDHWSAVLAAEEPWLRVWAVDPGDMRTAMHQAAFPGEDISDRPLPAAVVPALLALVAGDRPSGRVRAADLVAVAP